MPLFFGNTHQIFLIISTLYPKHRNPQKKPMSFFFGGRLLCVLLTRSRGSTWARRWFLCWIVYHRVPESTRCPCRERRLDFFSIFWWKVRCCHKTPKRRGERDEVCVFFFGGRGGNVIKVTCGQILEILLKRREFLISKFLGFVSTMWSGIIVRSFRNHISVHQTFALNCYSRFKRDFYLGHHPPTFLEVKTTHWDSFPPTLSYLSQNHRNPWFSLDDESRLVKGRCLFWSTKIWSSKSVHAFFILFFQIPWGYLIPL